MFEGIEPPAGPPRPPASSARLAAMATVILRAAYGLDGDPLWEAELIGRVEGMPGEDKRRLQGELDRMVDEMNGGVDDGGEEEGDVGDDLMDDWEYPPGEAIEGGSKEFP